MSPDAATDLLTLSYRSDLNIFVGRWGYQPTLEELPDAYTLLRREAVARGGRFWLQDIRRRAFNHPSTTHWLLTDYFPDVSRALGGRLYVAYLVGPALMQTIMKGPDFQPTSTYNDKPFVVAFFGDEGEAMSWLHQQQPQASQQP